MKYLLSNHWFRIAAGFTAFLLIVAFSACWQTRIWSLKDFREYQEACRYGIGRDLWFGRIRPGESVDVVVHMAPPHDIQQFGNFTTLAYYPGGPLGPDELPFSALELIAKDGRVVRAWAVSCTWDRKFFDMKTADADEYERRRTEEYEDRKRRNRKERDLNDL